MPKVVTKSLSQYPLCFHHRIYPSLQLFCFFVLGLFCSQSVISPRAVSTANLPIFVSLPSVNTVPRTKLVLSKHAGGVSPLGWSVLWERPHTRQAGFSFALTAVSAACVPYAADFTSSKRKVSILLSAWTLHYAIRLSWAQVSVLSGHMFFCQATKSLPRIL